MDLNDSDVSDYDIEQPSKRVALQVRLSHESNVKILDLTWFWVFLYDWEIWEYRNPEVKWHTKKTCFHVLDVLLKSCLRLSDMIHQVFVWSINL